MFSEILKFELKYRFKRPATYAYFGVLFFFAYVLAIWASIGGSEKTNINSPDTIMQALSLISVFGIMLASAIMGVPVFRDIEHKTNGYFFSYPITEKGYLLGRFVGSFITLIFTMCGAMLGYLFGTIAAHYFGFGDNGERYGAFGLSYFLWPMLIVVIPNLFLAGSLFFSLVALTKRIFVAYSGGILLLIGYLISSSLMEDLDNKKIANLFDPFGLTAIGNITKYWTPVERNVRLMPLEGDFLLNRLLWLAVGFLPLLYLLFRFDFQKFLVVPSGKKTETKKTPFSFPKSLSELSISPPVFSTNIYLKQMLGLARLEFKNVVKDPFFIAILLAAALFMFMDCRYNGMLYGTNSLPATQYMIEAKDGTFYFIVIILIVFCTGEVVHRDRAVNYHFIADALPVPNWLIYGSKFLSMIGVMLFVPLVGILCGIAFQISQLYFKFELPLYFQGYSVATVQWLYLVMLTFFVHILVNNKMLGHVVNVGLWVVIYGLRGFTEINYRTLFFNSVPTNTYSALNGFGNLTPTLWYLLCWGGLALVFLTLGNLFWGRGTDDSPKARWALAKQRFSPTSKLLLSLFTFVWLGSAGYIYYNQSILNKYRNPEQSRELAVAYEKNYRKYYRRPQPKITSMKINVDLFLKERRVESSGVMTITNKTTSPIDSLHLEISSGFSHFLLKTLTINGLTPKQIFADDDNRYYIYKLPQTLQPGDSATMAIATTAQLKGFRNGGEETFVIADNGTFFNAGDIFPTFGYNPQNEMTSEKYRKKYKLPIREFTAPARTDAIGLQTFLFNDDADWITFEGTVSTDQDQTAVMPGYLQKQWTANGRKYFSYKQTEQMDLFFSIASARYEVHREKIKNADGKDIAVEIFHHPDHKTNVQHFVDGLKDGLSYCSANFSPYQYKQMRIMEFPRYATYAQSFPNTIMYSENFGFLADFSDPNKTDYAYYVTAHEVAHQWWGHQVMPSFTRGGNNISETMAEYSSLMTLSHKYGPDAMQDRLKYALDQYLGGRGGESKGEQTMMDNEDGAYIWYGKGSLTFYALQDMIGEKNLNNALKDYAKATSYRQKAPYTTTDEWYKYVAQNTPDSLKYFVEDCMKKIVLYENQIKKAEAKKLSGDQYQVTLTLDSRKLYYDKKGNEIGKGKAADLIEVGIFAEEGKNRSGMKQKMPLYLKKLWLKPGQQTLTVTVKGKPIKAGIDPYNKLIDRVSDDNLIQIDGI